MQTVIDVEIPEKIIEIAKSIRQVGGRAFLVGGFVRDALLGNQDSRDFDIEVYDVEEETLLNVLNQFGKTNAIGKAFGVFHLYTKGLSIDFSFPRTESKIGYGHRGFLVKTDSHLSFKEAAYRRDFTINAMGMELPEKFLCDPYEGKADLEKKVLRHVSAAFSEDSLRILRGVQFASRFELEMSKETISLCRSLSLSDLSIERLYEEFKKWLLKPGKPSLGLKAFLEIDLHLYFKEIKPILNDWNCLGALLDSMFYYRESGPVISALSKGNFTEEERMEMAFAALLLGNCFIKDFDKKQCKENALEFLGRITNEIHLMKKVPEILLIFKDLDLKNVPEAKTLRRYALSLGGLKILCCLIFSLPKNCASREYAEEFLKEVLKLDLLEKAPMPFLTGKMLLELGMVPGKEVGKIIQESFEMQLDGVIKNAEEALAFAKTKISTSI